MRAFLVRGRRDLLVDTGTPGSVPHLRAALARLGTGLDRLSLVVITHGHLLDVPLDLAPYGIDGVIEGTPGR